MSDAVLKATNIHPAQISWQKDHAGLEVPVSENFGDVYFSRDNGLAETRHVFLQGNQLAARLANLKNYEVFTVGELGFGTGLNILALWQLWQHTRKTHNNPHARLHVITTEKFPLTKADLTRALASWETLARFSQQLTAQYPPLLAGCHRLNFPEDNFSIDLWLGDAADSLAKVSSYTPVNAWFLDGFAPSCNEQLWADAVLDQIQRLSGNGSTAATFSVAGVIKRGLTERGFSINKVKGFGKKREMLTAFLPSPLADEVNEGNENREALQPIPENNNIAKNSVVKKQHVAIIGAGVAGLCTAFSFARRGHQVTLVDKTAPLAGASGNPCAMLAPKLTPIHHVHEHMHSIGYLYATRFYQQLSSIFKANIYQNTSVLDLLKTSNVSPQQINDYPERFVSIKTAQTATALAGVQLPESMYLPAAGLVNPQALADAILSHANITFMQANITNIKAQGNKIQLFTAQADTLMVDNAIICTAQDCHLLQEKLPTPRSTRGQVSWFEVTTAQAETLPNIPLKYGGYCAKVSLNHKHYFMLGASFIRGTTDLSVKQAEHQQSLDKFTSAIPNIKHIKLNATWQGRAGLRAQMPDYLPLVGKVTEGIFALAAMGSKGFAYAPICAEVLAAQLLGEVAPLPHKLETKLNPLRFYQG